ncbi:MAG: hypothetical protein ACE5FK_02060 [Candidatus Methylomirabilia bacterium]
MKLWVTALTLVVGLVLGVGATRVVPRLAGSYLSTALLGKTEIVEGTVVAKEREEGRILLTLVTPKGSLLATFTDRAAEVDLLIATGDTLTLTVRGYEPFVDEPTIERVRKPEPPPQSDRPELPPSPNPS